jgi:hypothetical protein
MEIINNIYEQLNDKFKITKDRYSTNWLKRSKSYYAYLNSTNSEASIEVLLALYGNAMRQRKSWEETAKHKSGNDKALYTALYTAHTDCFRNIESNIESAIRKQALTM